MLQASAPVAVVLLGSVWLAGCDTPANQNDRKVQAQADASTAQAAIDQGEAPGASPQMHTAATTARKTLESAAADNSASPITRAFAKSALAQIELNDASKIMRQIDLDDARLHQLIFEISQLAQQVDASRAIAVGYDKYNPKPVHDAIAADIAAVQGGPNQPTWNNQDGSSIPSLAAVIQTISQLQTQIAKQADDLKVLQDHRTQVLDDADQADKSSEISKGQQSVDDFKRAADLRKQAGDLTVQIEKNQAQTIPLQKDLAVAQGQQVVLQELLKQFQDQSQALDAGWKSVQDAVAAQAVLQNQIVKGNGESTPAPAPAPAPSDQTPGATGASGTAASILPATAGGSLNDKADALAKLVQQIAQERSDALSKLNSAISHYGDSRNSAASAAKDYFDTLDPKIKDPANAQRPEQDAWKTLEETMHPTVYHMDQALAQRQLAELYLAQIDNDKRLIALQDEVTKLLGAASIPVPPALSDPSLNADKLDADKKAAVASAGEAYNNAETQIKNLKSGSAPAQLKDQASVQDILTLYGQVQLARATGDTSAGEKLKAATDARDEAIQNGLQLPPLPPEIAPAPGTPAAAPAPGT